MKTKLHYYRFSIDKEAEAKDYKTLCNDLKEKGLKLFASISMDHSKWYKESIKPLNDKEITLETEHLFNNQWNTAPTETSENGLRVFDWSEAIYPNIQIKEGMYLDQTPEMQEIRENTFKCGYCGKNYFKPMIAFCKACLDSEYLEEKDLFLLRLLPVNSPLNGNRPELTQAEKTGLLPRYIKRQTTGATSRSAAKLRKQRASIKARYNKNKEANETEYQGFIWLMDNNVNIDNVIYYSHTDRFGFGWKSPVSESVKSVLLDVLCEFPFNYDIK